MTHDTTLRRINEIKSDNPGNIGIACFDPVYFKSLAPVQQNRLLKCLNSGIENPDSEMGCYASLAEDYDDFRPFFTRVLSRFHGVAADAIHQSNWSLRDGLNTDLAQHGLPQLSLRIRVGRNLKGWRLTPALSLEERIALENTVAAALLNLSVAGKLTGSYHSLTPGHPKELSDAAYADLIMRHLMFKDMAQDRYLASAGIAANWPHGRGCFISDTEDCIIWVGEEDHLRIMVMRHSSDPATLLQSLHDLLQQLESQTGLAFAHSPDLGFITACPTNLGTAMRASAHVQLPRLIAVEGLEGVRKRARALGLAVRGVGGEHTGAGSDGTVDLSPRARFCVTESEIVERLSKGIVALHRAETGGDQ